MLDLGDQVPILKIVSGFLPGILSEGKIYCFRTRFQEGAKVFEEGQTASGGDTPDPMWKNSSFSPI